MPLGATFVNIVWDNAPPYIDQWLVMFPVGCAYFIPGYIMTENFKHPTAVLYP